MPVLLLFLWLRSILLIARVESEGQDAFSPHGNAVERRRLIDPLARRGLGRSAQRDMPADGRRLSDAPRFRNDYLYLDLPRNAHGLGASRVDRLGFLNDASVYKLP